MSYRVIDADGHVTESSEQLLTYIRASGGGPRPSRLTYPNDNWDRSLGGTLGTRASDAETWLRAMDGGGVETAVLYPTGGLGIGWVREPEWAAVLSAGWNDFFFNEFRMKSPRLLGVALVAPHEPQEAAKELRRAVQDLGMVGAMLPATGYRLPLGHRDLDPIYDEAQRLGCMIGVHATVRGPHYFGADLFDSFVEVHTMSHAVAQMTQLTSMVLQGVPERFPDLKIAYLEAGCTWVPYWANRLDEEWEKRGAVEAPLCKRKPSDYIRGGNLYFSVEDGETLMGPTADFVGHNQLMYATDFPHWDNSYPESLHAIEQRSDLSEDLKRKILGENAERLYAVKVPA